MIKGRNSRHRVQTAASFEVFVKSEFQQVAAAMGRPEVRFDEFAQFSVVIALVLIPFAVSALNDMIPAPQCDLRTVVSSSVMLIEGSNDAAGEQNVFSRDGSVSSRTDKMDVSVVFLQS